MTTDQFVEPKPLTKGEALKSVREVMASVEDWVANDGGLTMAAGDVLGTGNCVINGIEMGNVDYLWSYNDFSINCSSGEEMCIAQIACEYAKPYVWAAWRTATKAKELETPRELIKRRYSEGMRMAIYKIVCPPDRLEHDWKKELMLLVKEVSSK